MSGSNNVFILCVCVCAGMLANTNKVNQISPFSNFISTYGLYFDIEEGTILSARKLGSSSLIFH